MNTINRFLRLLFVGASLFSLSLVPAAEPVVIKLATLAPVGSPWYDVLVDITHEWERISNNRIQVRLYPGGVAGDERDLVTKLRLGHLHAAGMTATGISELDKGIWALSLPLMLQEYNQLDWLRAQVNDVLVQRIDDAGFIVLAWADVGWVYWFCSNPIYTPADLQKQRIFTWAGGPNIEGLWKSGGFHSVTIAGTDVLPALQTGLIDAIGTASLVAATYQWFAIAKYMNPVKWSVMTGAIIISKEKWAEIPADLRPKLIDVTHKHQERITNKIRQMDNEAIRVMKEYGLQVVEVTPEQEQEWHNWLEPHLDKLRGLLTDTTMFDWVMELRKDLPPPEAGNQ